MPTYFREKKYKISVRASYYCFSSLSSLICLNPKTFFYYSNRWKKTFLSPSWTFRSDSICGFGCTTAIVHLMVAMPSLTEFPCLQKWCMISKSHGNVTKSHGMLGIWLIFHFSATKHAFSVNPRGVWFESERCWSQGPEISVWRRQNDDCVGTTFA